MMLLPHHNFVVIAQIILKFGTDMNLDVFYTMVAKIVTSLPLRSYDVIACILAKAKVFILDTRNSKTPWLI